MTEHCETTCAGCGKPVKYDWQDGFISSPDTVLVADWLFHVECWKDPPARASHGPCALCGAERVHTRTADDGDKGYDCRGCGAQTWDRGLLGGQAEGESSGTERDISSMNDDEIDF